MKHPTRLRGMTWNHSRGYDPLHACSALYERETGVPVSWDRRSLQDFESFPVSDLARTYDLIVIDHPHIGQITHDRCLVPFEGVAQVAEREAIKAGSVGPSYESYNWMGRQWAFPIDAAAPVLAYRPDLIATPPRTWNEVLAQAERGNVLMPFRAPHSLMAFFTFAGLLGTPCNVSKSRLIEPEAGVRVVEQLRRVVARLDAVAFEMDPIDVFERMAEARSTLAIAPLIYGYVSYSVDGFRPHRLAFTDMPVIEQGARPCGSALGGTGIAVSAFSAHKQQAVNFAYWIASADIQRKAYAMSGGQPGHSAAWSDDSVNRSARDFYRNTRATLDEAFVRPRHKGYMAFQHEASIQINRALKADADGDRLINGLNRMFTESFALD